MKTIALGVLFAVALVSVAGCHWRHRRWRNHHDYSYNSQPGVDSIARGHRSGNADT